MKKILLIYIVLMPFMSALALSEWLPLPLVFIWLVSPIILFKKKGLELTTQIHRDLGWIVMFFLGFLAMAYSPLPLGIKNLNYSAAMIVCYLSFFLLVRIMLTHTQVRWSDISNASHVALAVLSLATIFEFYTASFHGVYFSDIIPFAHEDLNIANLVNDNFKRPRAFSLEPGFTALAFECLWPLTFLDFKTRRFSFWIHTFYGTAFILLASAAAIGCLIVAVLVVWLNRGLDWRNFLKVSTAIILVLVPLSLSESGQELLWSVFGRKVDIFTLDVSDGADGVSALFRLSTYKTGLSIVAAFPVGVGWGGVGQAFFQGISLPVDATLMGSGMLSLYLDIAVASGVLGLFAFLWFIGLRISCVLSSTRPESVFVSCALISVCFHHVFITELQLPFLWFMLALADKFVIEREKLITSPKKMLLVRKVL